MEAVAQELVAVAVVAVLGQDPQHLLLEPQQQSLLVEEEQRSRKVGVLG